MIRSGTIKVDLFDKLQTEIGALLNKYSSTISTTSTITSTTTSSNNHPAVPTSTPSYPVQLNTVPPPTRELSPALANPNLPAQANPLSTVLVPVKPMPPLSTTSNQPEPPKSITKNIIAQIESKTKIENDTTRPKTKSTPATRDPDSKPLKPKLDPRPAALVPTEPQRLNTVAPNICIVIRKFEQKRGGVKVILPATMNELIQIANEKLKISAVCFRESTTEAEISDVSLFKQDMLVWAMTADDEKEFQ